MERRFFGSDNSSVGEKRALYSEGDDFPTAKSSFKAFWGGSLGAKSTPDGGKTAAKYSVGMRVKHPKFGLGMVVSLKNNGNTVDVAFDGQGIKELSASLAPLEIIKQ